MFLQKTQTDIETEGTEVLKRQQMNIRTQLTFRYIGIVLLVLLAVYIFLGTMLKDSMSNRITSELEVQAALTREFFIEKLPAEGDFTYDTIDSLVDRLGKTGKARVTFIGIDGTVWGDTERDGQALRGMDNHLARPEVQDALKNGRAFWIDTATQHRQNFVTSRCQYIAILTLRTLQMEKAL